MRRPVFFGNCAVLKGRVDGFFQVCAGLQRMQQAEILLIGSALVHGVFETMNDQEDALLAQLADALRRLLAV